MSRLQKKPAPTMIEPEEFDEKEVAIEEEYSPQHPALSFHAELKSQGPADHLENYVEVKPFETKEEK